MRRSGAAGLDCAAAVAVDAAAVAAARAAAVAAVDALDRAAGPEMGAAGAAPAVVDSSLGTDREICCHTAENADFAADDWQRLKYFRRALPDYKRAQECMIASVPGTPLVSGVHDPNTGGGHLRYVEHCGLPGCPYCDRRIANLKREELTDGLARAKLLGWSPVLVTYTLRHALSDALLDTLGGLNRARRRMLQHRTWRALKEEYGLKGQIRGLEITWGTANGWHPHLHVLLLLDERLDAEQIHGLRVWLFDLWRGALAAEGFDASYEHGVDVRTAESEIAEYVAKWGHEPRRATWDVEHEIAKASVKLAHGDGYTPLQLLDASAADPRATALFREYVAAMKGRHRLEWSKGLRDELAAVELPAADGVPVELPVYTMFDIPAGENWNRASKLELQPRLIALLRARDADGLRALFRDSGVVAVVYDGPDELAEPGAQVIGGGCGSITAAGMTPGVALRPVIAGAALAPPAPPARQMALMSVGPRYD